MDRANIPSRRDLWLPILRAVVALGGSGIPREIADTIIEGEGFSEEMATITYGEHNPVSILHDRLGFARIDCRLMGVLESPRRGLWLITELGRGVMGLPELDAQECLNQLDRTAKKAQREKSHREKSKGDVLTEEVTALDDSDQESWREDLLKCLHGLTPDGFERFVRHLLRSLNMELKRTGGVGDQGIDLIGTAPISPVLTVTVAVQAKRYAPSVSVGRAEVALFQADASARGAEYGILVTTSRFTRSARETAQDRRPTITLIDGERLADLCLDEEVGIVIRPVVDPDFFGRFE
ncbi:DUF2034 domain-containing protein [Candidatus Spongiisocius sp.]|uniref:DUF2034 domain-containing protein n=1 Tax=Candidatus Spongiisocius sp. TaxID=3101273 RepID=UPI003B5B69AE